MKQHLQDALMVIVKVQVEIVKELLTYQVIYRDVRMAIIEVLMAIVKELQDRRHQQTVYISTTITIPIVTSIAM
jgi:hypothetical protein